MSKSKIFNLFVFSAVFLLIFNFLLFAEDITITTYYPSPAGVYDELKTNKLAVGSVTAVPGSDGDVTIGGDVNIGGDLNVVGDLQHNGTSHVGWDIAEYIKAGDTNIESGDVVVVDPDHNRSVIRSSMRYNSTVLGVISTAPGDLGGFLRFSDGKLYTKEEMEQAGYRMLTLVGQVPCKVTAENGPIKRGDLLVTSSKPGYAMKANSDKLRPGMILGKALEPLEQGEGEIVVLVK